MLVFSWKQFWAKKSFLRHWAKMLCEIGLFWHSNMVPWCIAIYKQGQLRCIRQREQWTRALRYAIRKGLRTNLTRSISCLMMETECQKIYRMEFQYQNEDTQFVAYHLISANNITSGHIWPHIISANHISFHHIWRNQFHTNQFQINSLRLITSHIITSHHISSRILSQLIIDQPVAYQHVSLHHISSHYLWSNLTTLHMWSHHISWHHVSYHRMLYHHITLHLISSRHITSHNVTLHLITPITSSRITLPYHVSFLSPTMPFHLL